MTDHLNTFQGINNQLAGMNIKFEEEVQGLRLLGTLSDSWETFRTSLSNSAPDGSITMHLVKSCVKPAKNAIFLKNGKTVICHYSID